MARKKNIPVVGNKQLHPVQIAPNIRKLEARRTRAAAHRTEQPVINADKGAIGIANKEYRNEAASARGATNAEENALAQALAGLKGSGLSGRYLQQAKGEFTSRAADAASALPSLLAGAGEERTKALTTARTKLTEDRASEQSSAASAFSQRLKELRGQGSSDLKTQQGDSATEAKESKQELHRALNEGKRLLDAYPEKPPNTPEKWARFASLIENADGVGEQGALKAAKILQRQFELKKAAAIRTPFG